VQLEWLSSRLGRRRTPEVDAPDSLPEGRLSGAPGADGDVGPAGPVPGSVDRSAQGPVELPVGSGGSEGTGSGPPRVDQPAPIG
jgi:hypothetical protein